MMKILVFFVGLIAMLTDISHGRQSWSQFSFEDNDANLASQEKLREVLSDFEFGLQNFVCQWSMKVESSADSDLLFSSTGKLNFFQHDGEVVFSASDWTTETIDDSRFTGRKRLFPECSFELLTVNGVAYRDRHGRLFVDKENRKYRWANDCVVLSPLDAPFLYDSCFDPFHICGGAEAVLGEGNFCVATRKNGNAIETLWLDHDARGMSHGFKSITSHEGVPVRFELLLTNKPFRGASEIPDRKQCVSYSVVNTKWGKLDGISVPVACQGATKSSMDSSGVNELFFEAEMKYFGKDSQQFQAKYAELKPLIDKIKKQKETEEQPKPLIEKVKDLQK